MAGSSPGARWDTGRSGPSDAKAKAGSTCVECASPASAPGGRARRAGGLQSPSRQRGCSWPRTWRSVFGMQPEPAHLVPPLVSGPELARRGARWGPRALAPRGRGDPQEDVPRGYGRAWRFCARISISEVLGEITGRGWCREMGSWTWFKYF